MFFSYDFSYLSERWFDEALPVNYDEGLAVEIGSGTDGKVAITDTTKTALSIVAALASDGGADASTSYADGLISVELGTKLSGTIGSGTDGVVSVVDATKTALSIEVAVAEGANAALAAAYNDGTITVTLGTNAESTVDNAKNTATLVAGAINAIAAKTWTATASGTGATVFTTAIPDTSLTVIANALKNTATLVAAAINAIADKTWTATASGTGATAIAAFTEVDFDETVVYGTPCPIAGLGLYDPNSNLYYVCTEADNTDRNTHWIKLTPSSL